MKSCCKYIVFFVFIHLIAFSQENDYRVSIATSKARPLSMGGAFAAIENQLSALDFNPAGLNLQSQQRNQFFVFYNPFGLAAMAKNWEQLKSERLPFEWVVRGVGLRLGRVSMGLSLGEERIANIEKYQDIDFFESKIYTEERNGSFGISVALAPRVIIGAATEAFYQKDVDTKIQWGYRYGVILKPKTYFSFGLSYFDFPNDYGDARIPLERLTDESLNIGLLFQPVKAFKLACDVRNVSEASDYIAQEPHVGVEFIPYHHIAFRAGYYQIEDGLKDNYSFGLGLIDNNILVPYERRLTHPSMGINITYLIQKNEFETSHWFVFSSQFYF